MIPQEQLNQGIEYLADQGLNLFAAFSLKQLPEAITSKVETAATDQTLILIGHGGARLWEQLHQQQAMTGADPIDHFSIAKVREFANIALDCAPITIHYPGESPIGLQALGTLAGWHHPSPMRVGINQQWGLWYAYRAAFSTPATLPEIKALSPTDSPCTHCKGIPCISSCPVGAIHSEEGLILERCAKYRLEEHSPCAERCIAREACPVSVSSRYSDEQINYHYRQSLQTLQRYYAGSADWYRPTSSR